MLDSQIFIHASKVPVTIMNELNSTSYSKFPIHTLFTPVLDNF